LKTEETKKPKLAFAGVGWIGRSRLKAVAASGLADIVLISDPSRECIDEALKIAPESRATTSFEEILSDPTIDGVVIATPSALHKEQAVAALESRKAVFCQKPLGRNLGEVQAVVNAASANNRLLGADFSYRFTKAFQQILPVIQSGELGKLFGVDLKFHNAYGPDKPWFYDIKLSGGGCVLDLGIHLIDLMMYALRFPVVTKVSGSLFSKGTFIQGENVVEDYATATIETGHDVSVQLACSWNLAAGCEAVIEASFYGTNGGVALKNVNGSFYDFVGLRYRGTCTEILTSPPDDWGGRALLDWVKKLTISGECDASATQYTASAAVVDMIYGRTVKP